MSEYDCTACQRGQCDKCIGDGAFCACDHQRDPKDAEIAQLRAEVAALQRGEYICTKCGLRKEDCYMNHGEGEKGGDAQ